MSQSLKLFPRRWGLIAFFFILCAWPAPAQFRNFEGPQVHPLAITPDGTRLLALNTPNNQLLVYRLAGNTTTLLAAIPVGLEPVSVAVRNNREAWVANWVGDSVSIIDLTKMRVAHSFDTGDEPTDIVFTGANQERAFVCVSGLRQVKVYNANDTTAAPQVVTIRGKQPRALSRDATGQRVFVSVFESGNETTTVRQANVTANGGLPAPSPAMNPALPTAPQTGLIVKWNGASWLDERGTSWNGSVPYRLADVDVVVLQADTPTVTTAQEIRRVGTLIGNAAYDAANQRLVVANIEAFNQVRFEPNAKGRFTRTRLAALNVNDAVVTPTQWDANPHINYAGPGSDAERALSLALPADVKVAANGTTYVAATGSARVGVINSAGNVEARISVGQGPTGLALDAPRQRLYVLNRFDNNISVVDTNTRLELRRVALGFNPEPADVRTGRRFLYDATTFSQHGDHSCASCHAGGQTDGLAWDLGDPNGTLTPVTIPGVGNPVNLHPMKGPLVTQTLRGIIGTEPLHWRGDKNTLSDFNGAFVNLHGGPRQLNTTEMAQFTTFVQSLAYPPNPNRNLDRTLPNPGTGPSATRGQQVFNANGTFINGNECNDCHTGATGTNRTLRPAQLLQQAQPFKIPQLRNMYQKTGLDRASATEQLSGYGFGHDGSDGSMVQFLQRPVFDLNNGQRNDLNAFLMAFDTGLAPAVGLQITVNADNRAAQATLDRLNLLMAQDTANNCDLIVLGFYQGRPRGFVFVGNSQFRPDRQSEANVTLTQLLNGISGGQELTFMGVIVGTGTRLGIDNDGNGTLNGDEPQTNVADDSRFFVQQNYLDFLGRDPDTAGEDYWTNELTACGGNVACVHQRRIGVSAAFFIELEFQETGSFVYRFYKSSLGRAPGFDEFMPDRGLVVGGPNLEQNKQNFASVWVQRAAFIARYPLAQNGAQFVDALLATVLQSSGVNLTGQRATLISEYDAQPNQTAARARVARLVSDAPTLQTAEYNRAFVTMQYFGYLRRDIDTTGYDFWLDVITNREPGNFRGMVCAFITAAEYQYRFGTILTRSNADCN